MLIPLSHYLQSNQAPSEYETREIKALRANPLKEISIVDVEIEQIEGILDSLKRKRAHIHKSIDDFNTILAPVRRLPTDVLGVIFNHCLATHRNPVMSTSEAPILLTQICRDWRSIALLIPQLWSRLYVPTLLRSRLRPDHPESLPYALAGDRRMEARTEEVQRWLRLSASCPLAISLMPAGDQDTHPPLLDSIIQSSRRWQQFELGCCLSPDSEVMTRLLCVSPDDLGMLRELRIYSLYPTVDEGQDPLYQSGLLTAQGLRSISIGYMDHPNMFNAGIPPNWENLNQLSIHSPIMLQLAYQILTYCCNLAVCHLKIAGEWDVFDMTFNASQAITLSSFTLPNLTFLSLQGDLTGCSQLFSSIEAPFLKILDYHGSFPNQSEFGLLKFLQNINSLETLRVDHCHFTESNILKYYTLIPSVTHLVLGRSPKQYCPDPAPTYSPYRNNGGAWRPARNASLRTLNPYNFTALHEFKHQYSPDSSPTLLFPSLEIFEAYDISGVTDIMLLEFIKARIDATKSNNGVSKLKKVLVEFSGRRQTDIIPEALAYAQAAGIKLDLDLMYHTTRKQFDVTWSPSFGLLPGDVSWQYPLY